MTELNQNFTMFQGDSKNIVVDISSDEALDLTGATIKWALKKKVYSTENELLKTITDATNGQVIIQLEPVDTANLTGLYYHELELTDGAGNVSTIMTGNVTINKSGV